MWELLKITELLIYMKEFIATSSHNHVAEAYVYTAHYVEQPSLQFQTSLQSI